MMLLALTSVIACSLSARGFQLQSRTVQSEAHCSSDFSWADNSQKQSPCLVAAYVGAPCNQNNWDVPALDGSNHYNPPGSGTPLTPLTACTCSWASYNLISACIDCQGFSNITISWSAYSFNCAGLLSTTTYYPTNITLISGTLIPFWATTNPTSWTGAQFNSSDAQTINNKGHSDVGSPTSSTTTTTKSTPIGAIVGGAVGGALILLGAIMFGIYLFRRNSRPNSVTDPTPLLMNETHSRSFSDNNNNGYTGYTSLSSSPMHRSSPTIRTHLTRASTSIRSFPFFSSGGSTISHSMGQQSPPPVPVATQRDETAVEPFRLAPTNNFNPNRKQADGAYPMYDPPTARPTVRMEVQSFAQTPRGRTKFNPPAYEPSNASPEAGGSSSRRTPPTSLGQSHGKKGSADTQQSLISGGNPTRGNVVNQLGPPGTVNSHGASAGTSLNVLTGHGRQVSGDTASSDMERKRRPDMEDSFSARDIA